MIQIKNFLFVALGGGIGASLRYGINEWSKFGYKSTFIINMLGSLLIGVIIGLAQKNNSFDEHLKLFLATGVCGGFTTFSAFSMENVTLFVEGKSITALTYMLSSVVIGVLAAWIGLKITS